MNPAGALAPGFFGKLSSHGDFVSRRLPPPVLAQWDVWLQDCIRTSQQQLAAGWLPAYLSSPVWRFAVAGGVLDEQCWAGVLMASGDRIGRHFPLLVTVGRTTSGLPCWSSRQYWYEQVQALALSSTEPAFRLDQFDAAVSASAACMEADSAALMPQLIALSATFLRTGHTLWWDAQGTPAALLCRGLPDPANFGAMLDGSWRAPGWQGVGVAVVR